MVTVSMVHTLLYFTLQHTTVQNNRVRKLCSSVQYSTAHHSTMQRSALQYMKISSRVTSQHSMTQFDTLRHVPFSLPLSLSLTSATLYFPPPYLRPISVFSSLPSLLLSLSPSPLLSLLLTCMKADTLNITLQSSLPAANPIAFTNTLLPVPDLRVICCELCLMCML
jgi:hypothetical protein